MRFMVISFLLLFFSYSSAFSEPKVFTVTVKRVMGEKESRDDIREFAALEAERQALEKAGIYLKTETVVRDYTLVEDEITALTAGIISTTQSDEKWEIEAGHIIISLTYQITIDPTDVDSKIETLIKDENKFKDLERVQEENKRLLDKITYLREELAKANELQVKLLREQRQQLSDQLTAQEWFRRGNDAFDDQSKIEYFSNAITMNKNYAWAYNNRGLVYFETGQFKEAINDFRKAIDLDSNSKDVYINLGVVYFESGNADSALISFNDALKLDPACANAYYHIGIINDKLKKYVESVSAYTQAIIIDSVFVEAWNNRGIANMRLKKYEDAVTDFQRALELEPEYATAANNLGITYYRMKKYQQAVEAYSRAIDLHDSYASAYFNRGIVYCYYLKDKEKARSDFQAASELGHDRASEELAKLP